MASRLYFYATLHLIHFLHLEADNTFECVTTSALNTDHQFHCCYTNRDPNCQNTCVDNERVCDGTPDCPDARDEWSSLCDHTCTLGYREFKGFQCVRAWRRCLSFNRFCDEQFDCAESELDDKSDEDNCECYFNKDCPFFGNLSATLPPAPTIEATTTSGPETNKTVIILVIVVIAILSAIVVSILAFLVKTHLSKASQSTIDGLGEERPSFPNAAISPSAPSPASQHLFPSPARQPLSTMLFTPDAPPDAPPPYEEVDSASASGSSSELRRVN